MKFKTRDIIIMALAVVLIYVLGKINFAFSRVVPIPGFSTALRAPLYAFVLTGVICETRKIGTISMVMAVYAIIMSVTITPFSGIAILIGAVLADIITILFIRNYKQDIKVMLSAALFAPCALIGTIFVISFLTTAKIHIFTSNTQILITLALTALFSLAGSYMSVKLLSRKVACIYGKANSRI